jgi:hypothetical protein
MGARDILGELHDAGLSIALAPDRGLKVTPASSLTPELRDVIRASKDLLIDWLAAATEADPDRPDGQGSGKVSSKVSTETEVSGEVSAQPLDREAWPERAAIAEYDGGLSRQDAEAMADACCWPYSSAMTGAEIDTFTARLARFTDKGLSLIDAEALADKLVIRDREGDDRRVCLECAHLRYGGRCGNWQVAGVAMRSRDAQLPPDLILQLQRCDGFATATPGATPDSIANTPFERTP